VAIHPKKPLTHKRSHKNNMFKNPTFAQHLDPSHGPKRILCLDGGGIRGVLSLGMLLEMETLLRVRHGSDPAFRLSDYFDLIAGTSTGAIIAAALSLGMAVDEVFQHYQNLGAYIFKRSFLHWDLLQAKYDSDKVRRALIGVFEERCMGSTDFCTGLLVVTKRLDTGSVWPITNNPRAKYFKRGTQPGTIPNEQYPLWQVVRASTAAPYFFDPEHMAIGRPADGQNIPVGEFIDGGVSPSNNPSLQALMTATMEGHRLCWPAGQDQLLIVSVGAGKADAEIGPANMLGKVAVVHAVRSLHALMDDCADQIETIMQWLSSSPTARRIDREIDKAQSTLGNQAMCSYLRYNVHLQSAWCAENLNEKISTETLKGLQAMDRAENISELNRLGRLAGHKLILPGHFSDVFDLQKCAGLRP
jgi:uncharacterized protein